MLAASAVLVVAGALVLWQALSPQEERRPRPVAVAADPTPNPTPAAAPPEKKKERPKPKREARDDRPLLRLPSGRTFARGKSIARVVIPAIGVRAPMIKLGLNRDDSLKVPADVDKTGWWAGGTKPGRKGAAVIVGHVDSQSGPGVFHRLGELSDGDKASVVYNDGSRATFVVTGRERVPKNEFPTDKVYDDTPKPTLRLITCGGTFDRSSGHYRDNVIVYGKKA